MRTFIVAPANVDPNPCWIDVTKRMIERLNMHVGNFQKLIIAQIAEKHMPRQGKVRAV